MLLPGSRLLLDVHAPLYCSVSTPHGASEKCVCLLTFRSHPKDKKTAIDAVLMLKSRPSKAFFMWPSALEQYDWEESKTLAETMGNWARYLIFFQYTGTKYRWVAVWANRMLLLLQTGLSFHIISLVVQLKSFLTWSGRGSKITWRCVGLRK